MSSVTAYYSKNYLSQKVLTYIRLSSDAMFSLSLKRFRTTSRPALPCCRSENYIFGKFDTFCRRLNKVADMLNTMEAYAALSDVRIEGIETIIVRYKTIVDSTKKKTYDILDHRRPEVPDEIVYHLLRSATIISI